MKENFRASDLLVNLSQFFIGLTIQLLATLIYTIGRSPDQIYLFFKNPENIINCLHRYLRVSILSISILSVNINYHHFVNSIYNDDGLFCDTLFRKTDYDSKISIYDVYQLPSYDKIVFISLTKNIFISSYFLVYKFSARGPPS